MNVGTSGGGAQAGGADPILYNNKKAGKKLLETQNSPILKILCTQLQDKYQLPIPMQ